MKKLLIILILIIPSICSADFNDHTTAQKTTRGYQEDLVTRNDNTADVNVFRVRNNSLNLNLRIFLERNPFTIRVRGTDTQNFTQRSDLVQYLRNTVLTAHNDLNDSEVATSGYMYIHYDFIDGTNVMRVRERFKSLKHMFNHLTEDIREWRNPSIIDSED